MPELFEKCPCCEGARQLFNEINERIHRFNVQNIDGMVQIINFARVSVECEYCDFGYRLTPLGKEFLAHFMKELKK